MRIVLAFCLLGIALASPLPGEPFDGLLPVVAQIKGILSTDYGFQQLKNYLLSLPSNDLIAESIKDLVQQHTDGEWKAAVKALFAKIPNIAIEPGFNYPTLAELFGELKAVLASDEGISAVRQYLENLDTPNQLLEEVINDLLVLNHGQLKRVLTVLFSGIQEVHLADTYSVKEDLEGTLSLIKGIVIRPEGIQLVRDHLDRLASTNPALQMAKIVLSTMSDKSLISIVQEIGKNLPDVDIGNPHPDLLELIRKAKDLILVDEGLQFIRDYMNNLKTGNFLILQAKSALNRASNEEIKRSIQLGWKEVFGDE